jgi:hypothetical protein
MPAKLGFDRHAVWVEGTARPTWLQVFQLLDPAGDIGVELAMEARFGNPTSPWDVSIGDPLIAQIGVLHAHLEVWIGMMEPPAAQNFDVSVTKHALSSTLYNFERLSWLPCGAITGEIRVFIQRLVTPNLVKTPRCDLNRLQQAVCRVCKMYKVELRAYPKSDEHRVLWLPPFV